MERTQHPFGDFATDARIETGSDERPAPTPEELADEQRRIRRLRVVGDLTAQLIATDPRLTLRAALEAIDSCRRIALDLFPDADDMIFEHLMGARLRRIVLERFAAGPEN